MLENLLHSYFHKYNMNRNLQEYHKVTIIYKIDHYQRLNIY